jgi:hypothetical protein
MSGLPEAGGAQGVAAHAAFWSYAVDTVGEI